MFFLLPAQVLTGLVLYGFTLRVEWIAQLQAFRLIALAHTGLSYLLVTFLIGHLYLATTGDGPLDLVKTMITGCHEDAQVHGGE
jgi:thiosulfate reductase cytochrome b subunit